MKGVLNSEVTVDSLYVKDVYLPTLMDPTLLIGLLTTALLKQNGLEYDPDAPGLETIAPAEYRAFVNTVCSNFNDTLEAECTSFVGQIQEYIDNHKK